MKTLLFGLLILVPLCPTFSQNNDIIGSWEVKDKNEIVRLQVNANGTGFFDTNPFTYEIKGNDLEVTYDYGTIYYIYEVKNDQFTLKEGNLEHPYVFKRKQLNSMETKISTPTSKSIDSRLLGTWVNGSQSLQFLADGTLIRNGKQKQLFQTTEGTLRIVQGNIMTESPYQVSDSLLSVVLDGQILQLKK